MGSEEAPKNCNEIPPKEIEELASYKFLLGDFGIGILMAIARGARTNESIMMLSGVPVACVTGRMPVLLNLKLVAKVGFDEIVITRKGLAFLKCINECV